MSKAACLELRVREGVVPEYAYLKMKNVMGNSNYIFCVQDDEINIHIDYVTEQELLAAGMMYGKLIVEMHNLCFVHFAMIGG